MRVLVACEFSGIVRDAFLAKGHDAWSCDLIPTESGPDRHLIGDVLEWLGEGWDLMIAFPPCTYLCNSGVRWLYKNGRGNVRDEARWSKMEDAARFFRRLAGARIPKIAIENPIMHRYAREIIEIPPTQSVQPWQFGHGEVKRTCFWLKGLPLLKPTRVVKGRTARVHRASPGPGRWKERSRTFAGIAEAMADQWGET